jgi:F-type H+-transporting ATPase subunit epsilon
MANTFELRIVAPEGQVLREDVEFLLLPGEDGEIGVLAKHSLLIAGLKTGVLQYNLDDNKKRVAISGGFAEVANNKAIVLADTAEPGELIDLNRAMAAKERAEKRLSERSADIDIKRAEFALRRALARINAAGKSR